MKTTTVDCGKCEGKGKLSWTRNADGVCFVCGGHGKLAVTEEAVAEVAMPRATAIAKIKASLDRYVADGYSDEAYTLSHLIVRAPADVAERALIAFERAGGVRFNLERQIEADRVRLGRRIANVKRVA